MDFEAITTQEEFDTRIKERLDREKEKYEKKLKEFEGYKAKADEFQTKLNESNKKLESYEASKTRISELETKIAKYESDSVKTRIANEFGIPYELASRLSGDTEEEIRKDAQAISGFISKPGPLAPSAQSEEKVGKDNGLQKLAKGLFKEGE